MENGDLIVLGVRLDSINLEELDVKNWSLFNDALWEAVEVRFRDNPALVAAWLYVADIFGEEFAKHYYANVDRIDKLRDAEHAVEQAKIPVVIDGVSYPKIATFVVLWSGWESDNTGWIVQDGDTRRAVLTSHGQPKFATLQDLESKIAEYQKVLAETQAAAAWIHLG